MASGWGHSMNRRRLAFALLVSLGLHSLLVLSLRSSLFGDSHSSKQVATGDYGELSLCESPPEKEKAPEIDLKNLVPDLPKVPDPPQPPTQNGMGMMQPPTPPEMGMGMGGMTNTVNAGGMEKKGVPLHGKVKAGKTIIYLLDCSSSMSEGNALTQAKGCLLESLAGLDETVTFQIIAYNSAAYSHAQEPVRCTEKNRKDAVTWLEKITPQGASNHRSGFEAACWRKPHALFLLTDADDLGAKELATLSKLIPEGLYLNVAIFGESETRGLLEKLTEQRGGVVRRYSQK